MVADGEIPPEKQATAFGSGRASAGTESDGPRLDDVGKNVGAAYAAALTYLSTQMDRLRVGIRHLVIFSVVGVVTALILVGVLITATVLLLSGVAGAISGLLGIPIWAGQLITGAAVIGAIFIVLAVMIGRMTRAARRRTMSSYEKPGTQK